MSGPGLWRAATALLAVAWIAVVVRLAWVGDDAYITLRTVENWLAGHGLVWNPGERVQTFTHPLWMLLLAAGRALSGEAYFTALALGFGLSSLAVLTLLRTIGAPHAACAALALLLSARSFSDYATSGLENPLAYLLLALLAALHLRPERRSVFALALVTALLATTRYDFALLAAPVLFTAMLDQGLRGALGPCLLGMLPFTAWFAFAALYYGTPFPITAYAKAFAHGIPAGELVVQGLHYLRYLAVHEPGLLLTTLAGIALGLRRGELRCRPLALGALLYVLYVVKVGGDFMSGRFLTGPFVLSLAIVGRWLATRGSGAAAATIVGAIALTAAPGVPAWLMTPTTEVERVAAGKQSGAFQLDHGILDERANYYEALGLLSPRRSIPQPGVFSSAMRATGRTTPMHMIWGQVGRFGFEAGDLLQIVDPWLCDPLLMRLPVRGAWRIGHFKRSLPAGYLQSRATDPKRIHSPDLLTFATALATVLRAPVADPERIATLLRLWRGEEDAALARFVAADYRTPPRVHVPSSELEAEVPVGTQWFDDPRIRVVGEGGLAIDCGGPRKAGALQVRVQPNVKYRFRLLLGGVEVAQTDLDACDATRFLAAPELANRYQSIRQQAPAFFDSVNGTTLLLACCFGLQQIDVPLPNGPAEFDHVLVDTVNLSEFGIAAVGSVRLVR